MNGFKTLIWTGLILFAIIAASIPFMFGTIGAYQLQEKFISDDSSPNHYLSTFASSMVSIFYHIPLFLFYALMLIIWAFGVFLINPDIPEIPEKVRVCLKNSNWIKRE